jgi:hypothetical protein
MTPHTREVDVSVVIPTYRRPGLLRRCLEALLRQTCPPASYEIVVVDDAGCTETRALVAELATRTGGAPALRYVRAEGTRGPAAARNHGWRAARASVIAFTDDDTVPQPDWLQQGLRAMTPGRVAISGRIVVPINDPPTDNERNTSGLEKAEFATANAFARREALHAIGGFDERFLRAWREDSDLQFSLMRVGEVGHEPLAVVLHPVRESPWGISLRQQANMLFDALLFKKHPRLYRTRIRAYPPWRYYLVVLSTFGALGCALAGATTPALLLALLALAVVLAFTIQRLRGTSHSPSHVLEMLLTSCAIPFLAVFWRLAGAWRFRVLFV